MAETERRLPIKVVLNRDGDWFSPDGGGGGRKMFGEVTPDVRRSLSEQLASTARILHIDETALPAVGRVVLKRDALAKSHRPAKLFRDTCPIIGVGHLGELFISLRPGRIEELIKRIDADTTKDGQADISTIEQILPHDPNIATAPETVEELAARVDRSSAALKVKLFRHNDPSLDKRIQNAFLAELRTLDLAPPEPIEYAKTLRIYRIRKPTGEAVRRLARFVGSQSVSTFPIYRSVRTSATRVRAAEVSDFPSPDPRRDYPVVGLIDSGVNAGDALLAPWIVAHDVNVHPSEQDLEHGSFVAGLLVHGRLLNQNDPTFPDGPCKIVDVVAVPKGGISEDQLLTIIEDAVPKYPKARVWNLSVNSIGGLCLNDAFSDFAVALDEIQAKYGVRFVVSAGNYVTPPLRGWPAEDLGEADRICAPADSVHAITVGSIAHIHRPNSRVKAGEPSPFSRRGPGPVYLPKPDLSHYGGNCDAALGCVQTGVLSLDANGDVAESIGTSFATPLVTSLYAHVHAELTGKEPPSPSLVKALLIHSALLSKGALSAVDMKYRGFGVPGGVLEVLSCTKSVATLIFEPDLISGLEFEKLGFPIPTSLRDKNGKVRGEFAITLVYDPPCDALGGAEYCRSNVEVSLGSYDVGTDGKRHHKRQVPPEPEDVNKLFEHELLEHGFKWSPVKVYRRSIRRGIRGDTWRLHVSLQHRSGFQTQIPQRMALIVTLADPNGTAPVYDEIVTQMHASGWLTQDLQVKNRVRLGV